MNFQQLVALLVLWEVSPYHLGQIRHRHHKIHPTALSRSSLRLSASSSGSDYGSDEFADGAWGQSDDWSVLSAAASPSISVPASYDYDLSSDLDILEVADELLEEQQLVLSETNAEVDNGDEADLFVENAVDVISGNLDLYGGELLYDTESSVASSVGDFVHDEDDEIAHMIRCNESPSQLLIGQGRALPELTDEIKYSAEHLLRPAAVSDESVMFQPVMTPFFERSVRRIFEQYASGALSQRFMDRSAIAKWMSTCLSQSQDGNTQSVSVGSHDTGVSALLSRYSMGHGTGKLDLAEFQTLYLEVAWVGYLKHLRELGKYQFGSLSAVAIVENRKNSDALLKGATLPIVWRDLEAHGIFSPAEEERVEALRNLEHKLLEPASSSRIRQSESAANMFMDECELIDDYEDRLLMRSYTEYDNEVDTLVDPEARKTKSSYDLVEMTSDGSVPLRIRDDSFVFIDEESCIGCTQCVTVAPNTFTMEETGRARAYFQRNTNDVKHAVSACPVDCMHFVSFDELKEMETARDSGKGLFGKAHIPLHVAGRDSDVNRRSSWYHHLKQKCHGSKSCPQRGCFDCPTYGKGENPFFKEKHSRAERARAEDFLASGEADQWRKIVSL